MGAFANLGSAIGEITFGKKGERKGKKIGKYVDAVAPFIPLAMVFKTGGRVPKTGIGKLHKNEFVLPSNVPPTKEQIKKVNKLNEKRNN